LGTPAPAGLRHGPGAPPNIVSIPGDDLGGAELGPCRNDFQAAELANLAGSQDGLGELIRKGGPQLQDCTIAVPPQNSTQFMSTALTPFHLAIPVDDLSAARRFYGGLLGCPEGRSAENWIDFNLFGHQVVCHLRPRGEGGAHIEASNPVDGHEVPIPHFGVVLEMEDWKELADSLREVSTKFLIEPYVRFQGEPGEQATMFFLDPSGNALEFKAFRNISEELFAK